MAGDVMIMAKPLNGHPTVFFVFHCITNSLAVTMSGHSPVAAMR